MWADWMRNYDLRLTKEEIEEYKRRKRGQAMKLLDRIMRLFGYENINNIKIPFVYMKTPPSKDKMRNKREFYMTTRKFMELIIITKDWFDDWYLVDGYTSYLIAKENNIKYVKVVRI